MTIRWGILGCGDVARRRVAGAIQQDAESELLAACRRNSEALQQFCGEFGVPRGYSDEVDLIADPDIDAVYIATPVDRHLLQTLACAGVGKHVLCEKPMAMTIEEDYAIQEAVATSSIKHMIAFRTRFAWGTRALKKAIPNPKVTNVTIVHCRASNIWGDDSWAQDPEKGV